MAVVNGQTGIFHVCFVRILLAKPVQITDENASAEMRPYISVEEFEHKWGQNTIVSNVP